jgi:hypothetical protein
MPAKQPTIFTASSLGITITSRRWVAMLAAAALLCGCVNIRSSEPPADLKPIAPAARRAP